MLGWTMMKTTWILSISTLIISLFLPKTILAAAAVTVTGPTEVTAMNEFSLSIAATGLDPTTKYYFKGVGGNENYDIQTKGQSSNWLNWNSSWNEFPQFESISDGTLSTTLTVRFRNETTSGSKNVRVRIRKLDTEDNIDSNDIQISVTALPQTTPSPTPSLSPTPTITPKPTSSPTIRPTAKATSFATSRPTSAPQVLSATNQPNSLMGTVTSPTPTPQGESTDSPNIVAISLSIAGVVFLGLATFPFLKSKLNRV